MKTIGNQGAKIPFGPLNLHHQQQIKLKTINLKLPSLMAQSRAFTKFYQDVKQMIFCPK